MGLPSTGSISINSIATYIGKATNQLTSIGESVLRSVIGISTGAISLDNFRGFTLDRIDLTYPAPVTGGGTTSGNYRRLFFGSTGSITVNYAPSQSGEQAIYYLVVAGGGGGGGGISGGGGGGGVRTGTVILGIGTYPIVIGSGGGGGVSGPDSTNGSNGNPSSFAGIVAAGGGRGGRFSAGNPGGSGGGGSVNGSPVSGWPGGSGNVPATTPPQGNPGGTGSYTVPGNGTGGGGGGAGAAGTPSPGPFPTLDGNIYRGGPGGNGVLWDAESTFGFSTNYYGAGGGGGCSQPGGVYAPAQIGVGTGGLGGGGNGALGTNNATAGEARGCGGGGGGQRDVPQFRGAGGQGGSGVVKIIYKYQ